MKYAVLLAALLGCSSTERVQVLDNGGVRDVYMSPEELAKTRSGELVHHALLSGTGFVADCAGDSNAYPGEVVMHDEVWWGGQCNFAKSLQTSTGHGSFAFSLYHFRWTNGTSMDETIRSASTRAPVGGHLATRWNEGNEGRGPTYSAISSVNGTQAWAVFGECATTSGCTKPFRTVSHVSLAYSPPLDFGWVGK